VNFEIIVKLWTLAEARAREGASRDHTGKPLRAL